MNQIFDFIVKNLVQISVLAMASIVGYVSLYNRVEANTKDINTLITSGKDTVINSQDIAVIKEKLENIEIGQQETKQILLDLLKNSQK